MSKISIDGSAEPFTSQADIFAYGYPNEAIQNLS